MTHLLPLADDPAPERADAARNRQAILAAALHLVETRGVACVTMDTVASEAGVGKGTLFRRFESREGLMAAVLNESETAWQASVISGPPPLGPGAPAMERLHAFGHSRLRANLVHADLIAAAGAPGTRSVAALSFANMHVRYLLGELGVTGDLLMLATAVLAPLEMIVLEQQVNREQISLERIEAGWDDLVRRIVGC
ncbi:AcrR family transcriptional regulator [Nocardioides cavernae]|uniref:AcrR family transcriptional regulator n=1 Tax=Nocardioides cavernae TaxID=1921566 RepID=A0A7Y9GZG0_9ACTN|nr:TetR/AcrR family transcriptional regulator [Nocardioides cavernae]NYE35013.1 AcrR family transcriptional regulator [Nocardioides cavernae]